MARGWRRISGWLGVVGAVAALLSFALPWYTTFGVGGKTYRGADLLWTDYIPYHVHSMPRFAPVGDCVGGLTEFRGATATLGGLALLALVGFLALLWLNRWRNVTFAVALGLFLLASAGLLVALPDLRDVALHTNYVQPGDALYPSCVIGGYGSGLTLLIVGLVAVTVASLWRTLLAAPGAPWAQGIAAALGLLGFLVVPWDLSATPGAVDFWSGETCFFQNANGLFIGQASCVQTGPDQSPSQFMLHGQIPVNAPFYLIQMGLLALVVALALLALRWRTPGTLRSLRALSLFTGIVGVLTGIGLEFVIATELVSPGAAVVGLAFLLLVCVGWRGWKVEPVPTGGRPMYNVATNTAERL